MTWLTWNCHPTSLRVMLELTMATASSMKVPTICF